MAERRLSFGDEISPERRKRDFGAVTIHALAPARSAFSIIVPHGWTHIPPRPREPQDRPGWRALDAFTPRKTVTVQLFQVEEPYEVNLQDWLEYQASLFSLELTSLEHGETEFGPLIHAAGAMPDGDRLRIVVAADGGQVFVLLARAAQKEPSDTDAVLGLIAASFLFQRHSGAVSREHLKAYAGPHDSFRLLYPASWKVEARDASVEGKVIADFRITANGDSTAYVRVSAETDPTTKAITLQALFERTIQELAEAGIAIEKLEAIPAGRRSGTRERWLGWCKFPSGPGQFALLFRRGDSRWLSAVMLAPAKTINPIAWMRAKRFYEVLTASLSTGLAPSSKESVK